VLIVDVFLGRRIATSFVYSLFKQAGRLKRNSWGRKSEEIQRLLDMLGCWNTYLI
jgi:hypothetical protein